MKKSNVFVKCYGVFCAGYSIVNREVAPYLELDKYCVAGWNTRVKVTFTAKIEWIESGMQRMNVLAIMKRKSKI